VILSNELPRFRDASGAIDNRLLILQMTNSFLGREDRTLDDQLRAELPGILSWALQGLDRLITNGRFTAPGASEDAANLMADLASPVSAFVRDQCIRDPQAIVLRDDLYNAWKQWTEDSGHQCGAKSTFGRDLRAVVPELKTFRPRVNGAQEHGYSGIGLKSYGLNGFHPDSLDSEYKYRGHSVVSESDDPDSALDSKSDLRAESRRPDSAGDAKPQVSDGELSESGRSAFKVQHTNSDPPPGGLTSDTPGQTDRVARALANAHQATAEAHDRYRNGYCRDCGERAPSAGRPRCDECHRIHQNTMAGYDQ
jgi:putative DNA primase/helicase